MTDAGALVCPSCGAFVDYGARRCGHCSEAVATVRCAACFHMSPFAAAHCAGCGRDLGLEPIPRDGTVPCPDCHTAMSALDCGPGAVHDCGKCGGQFVEVAALRDLLERPALDAGILHPRASQLAPGPVRYVACPVCRALMNRKNFGVASGVIVDVCAKHGTWFDRGELPRVLAFVESGGLARLHERETRERERLLLERSEHASDGLTIPTSFGSRGAVNHRTGTLVGDFLAALFGE